MWLFPKSLFYITYYQNIFFDLFPNTKLFILKIFLIGQHYKNIIDKSALTRPRKNGCLLYIFALSLKKDLSFWIFYKREEESVICNFPKSILIKQKGIVKKYKRKSTMIIGKFLSNDIERMHAVHPIGSELGKPSDMISAVRVSLVLCAVIYSSIGIFGYLLFGDSIMPDILVNFDQNSGSAMGALLNDTVRLSYALHLMLVFPLLNFSLRANVDELLFPKRPLLATATPRFMSITVILLVFSYFAAIAIPNIWYFFQFMGSTSAVCLAFIFPAAITLRYSL